MRRPTDATMKAPRVVEMNASSSLPSLSDKLDADGGLKRGARSAEPFATVMTWTNLAVCGL